MFNSADKSRVFGLPPGADFAQAFVNGLVARGSTLTPEKFARIRIFVNTARMQRRIRDVFDAGPPRLLPRVQLITDLALEPAVLDVAPPVSPLRRRLELSQFVAKLLDQQPDLAPRAALYDLSDSLAKLMDEMQGEGVSPDVLRDLDIGDQSDHWDRALRFLTIITPYFDATQAAPDREARQRRIIETLDRLWGETPPADPIIVAGSTGSRGATALFMRRVAALPQGAIVLPGYDFDLPDSVWSAMASKSGSEDHPQFRFHKLMDVMEIRPGDIAAWYNAPPPNPARNRLVSLSLRPAPITDQWLTEGPHLGDLHQATKGLTLVEAASPRAEAEAIALRLRYAADEGITAALISPDRMLTRQVAAALDRWDITPDDSAGMPLQLSPPGRFLRHIAEAMTQLMTGEALLTLLKHPLAHSDDTERGQHLLNVRLLELSLRRFGPPFPTAETLTKWAATSKDQADWAAWVSRIMTQLEPTAAALLSDHVAHLLTVAETIAAGPKATGSGALWDAKAGREALRICEMLRRDADAGGTLSPNDFAALFGAVLSEGVVRDRDAGHPNILIWGTLEARVQSADLVILGGMNEGVWPEAPTPDPWLNRAMRLQAGLLLPERRIGLSAHDYQQAVAGTEVWITRAKRSADAETVPSRWINRLLNLLNGLPDQNGPAAVKAMQASGDVWLARAAKLSEPPTLTAAAHRPSPRPPIAARPREISVTRVKTLIRDPYAIYAEKVLRLKPLDPLVPTADAPLRGIIMHAVLERFIGTHPDAKDPVSRDTLLSIAKDVFAEHCPWPTIRAQWLARLERIVDPFLAGEAARQAEGTFVVAEAWGEMEIASVGVKITCKADRFDLNDAGSALIYDYKTGDVPSEAVQKKFDKQLLIEAVMVERGAFVSLGSKHVAGAVFVAANTAMKDVAAPLAEVTTTQIWAELEQHLKYWDNVQSGYTARRALQLRTDVSPYDHLSRFGEWKLGDDALPEVLT